MTEIKVTISGTEGLEKAILALSQAINGGIVKADPPAAPAVQTAPVAPATYQMPMTAPAPTYQVPASAPAAPPAQPVYNPAPAVPVAPPQMQQTAMPQQMPQTAPTAIPTTPVAPKYTQTQLAIAMTGLVDAGKMDVVQGILGALGVQALTQVPEDRYPEVALKLREAGVQV